MKKILFHNNDTLQKTELKEQFANISTSEEKEKLLREKLRLESNLNKFLAVSDDGEYGGESALISFRERQAVENVLEEFLSLNLNTTPSTPELNVHASPFIPTMEPKIESALIDAKVPNVSPARSAKKANMENFSQLRAFVRENQIKM